MDLCQRIVNVFCQITKALKILLEAYLHPVDVDDLHEY